MCLKLYMYMCFFLTRSENIFDPGCQSSTSNAYPMADRNTSIIIYGKVTSFRPSAFTLNQKSVLRQYMYCLNQLFFQVMSHEAVLSATHDLLNLHVLSPYIY